VCIHGSINNLLEAERPRSETSAGYFSDEPALVDRLMKLVLIALETPGFATIAKDAYATILEASLHSRAVWEAFTCHVAVNHVHQMLLLAHDSPGIRGHVARKITSICGGDLPSTCPVTKPEIAARLWNIVSAVLPHTVQYPGQSEQLFAIAEHVFRTNDEYDRNEEHLRSFMVQWGSLLLLHDYREFPGREQTDHVVLGLTKLLLCCILSIKSFKKPVNAGSLMAQVFKKYIFVSSTRDDSGSTSGASLPVLESHTRQELYDLMLGLTEDSSTYGTLLQLVGEVENDEIGPVLSPNLVDRSTEIRSSTGYVGLYNPRAICYMNSLLTQLFMNLNFRQFILALDVKEASGSQRLLFETQRLFAQMQNSFRKSTDPRSFAACVRSLDKTPIDITVQMDADEFYNLLFDQWEGQLLTKEHKQKFRSFYGGQTMNQIKSKECEHVSERAEPFFAVQCDIAGKANLQDSLRAYVQGDVMEGDNKYKCESCDGKFVDAVKRTCFKDAPDNLIFHLKRFEFDLNDFSRRKIYDHFAFPIALDISPYKIDHLADPSRPRKEDWYDLVGVLVHTGTCENGHYYSYIRERPCSNKSSAPGTWIEFNDSDVGPFDPAEIAERTFGGFTEVEGYIRQTKQFSAYMLFYQRRAAVEEDQRRWITSSSDRAPHIAVPMLFEEETNINNELFIREYSLFDPVHARFLRQLHATSKTIHHGTCSESHEQEKRALHIVLAHLGHTAWRQYNPDIFLDLLLQLSRSILSCTTCCSIALQWLAADDHAVTNILVKCSHPKIRAETRELLISSLKYLRAQDPVLYGIEAADSDMEIDSAGSTECVLLAMTQRLRTTADETMESTRGWEDYYLMLTQMAGMGHVETAVLLNSGFLDFCLKLFCMHAHQPFRNEAPELARIMEKRRGIFNRLICFLWTLLSQMDIRLPIITESQCDDRQATIDSERSKFPLSRSERSVLMWWSEDLKAIAVLDKILETFDDAKVDHFYPGDIVGWMLEAPETITQTNLCRTMVEGIQLDPPYCNAYIRAALPFCEACPRADSITKVINSVAKAIGSPIRATEERLPGGLHVLRFFNGLRKAQNEALFERRHPYAFHHILMMRCRNYAIPLLCHYEEAVRKESLTFLELLYDNTDAIPPETVIVKYISAREVLSDLMHKFAYEKEIGRNRSFLVPLVETCRMFVRQLYLLAQSEEPEAQEIRDPNDAALIFQFQQEIEVKMHSWPHDESTPMSQGEAFEQSDYGSESDDAHDLLDN
jgi:ubiquitin carboxyl-terminal hydrolase 34